MARVWVSTTAETCVLSPGGPILDYKRGPSDAIDPSKVVGTYSINMGNNTVTYNYGDPSGPYTYVASGGASPNPETPVSSSAMTQRVR